MPLGIYISIPFCRSKCSFCNFASGVFSRDKMGAYVERLTEEIADAKVTANMIGGTLEESVDSIYFGGGTPTTLAPQHLGAIFDAIHHHFQVLPDAEITVECAPGTLSTNVLDVLLANATNRVSFGTQSFVDKEIRSVGRLHTAAQALDDIARARASGIENINVDLIAGLPHQDEESWRTSLQCVAELAMPHVSLYMLEVDDDSRLGSELIAGGSRYHAHHVPNSDLIADLYVEGLDFFAQTGIAQYEISNFARPGWESRHNLKYWTREPYLGFGLDAHSMLKAHGDPECFRFGNTDNLEAYTAGPLQRTVTRVSAEEAAEESMFLGLRLNRGIHVNQHAAELFADGIEELRQLGLVDDKDDRLRLTTRGRLLSNEVFERFVAREKV